MLIQIFDPALCCSTGVCGTETDPELVRFAADVDWAKRQGAQIERFNLAQQPLVFAEHAVVKGFLARSGQQALPLVLLDGEVALAGRYPGRAELVHWMEQAGVLKANAAGAVAGGAGEGAAPEAGGCCSGGKACC